MVVNFLMFLLIVGALYLLAYPDSQLAATTSAIGQIWSGSCRLSCRHSEYSGFSGISGLLPGNSRDKAFVVGQASYQGPSSCVCASCPCALIENVLRTFRPATTMYSVGVQCVATVYYALLQALSDMYNFVDSIVNCRASCQRPQLLENKDSASETLYFGKNRREDNIENSDKPRKSDSVLRPSKAIVFRDVSDTKHGKRDESSSKRSGSNATLKSNKQNMEDEDAKANSCPKCVKQGKVCMKQCPKAAKKK